MPRTYWRGTLYVYNYRTRQFLRSVSTVGASRRPADPGRTYCRWTPSVRLAKGYSNPGSAHKAAARINAEVYRHNSAKYPCANARPEGGLRAEGAGCPGPKPATERSEWRGAPPVDVVSGEAARCLELINRRG